MAELHVVTGAFGYTGRYLTQRLLERGRRVRTLTGHPERPHPFGDAVEVAPLDFSRPAELARSLRGAAVLYNTYWVRFPHGEMTYEKAVENTRALFSAAEAAGVPRVVHVSITHASPESPFDYFRGKGVLEEDLRGRAFTRAIVRPTVVFGPEGILLNNIAWLLRRFPVFGVAGAGDYRLQPVFVEDLAALAARAGEQAESVELDAVGPEVYTYEELVRLIAGAVGVRARIVHLPPLMVLWLSRVLGWLVDDVLLTEDELKGLMADLLVSAGPATANTRLSDWLRAHADELGRRYFSELARHYR